VRSQIGALALVYIERRNGMKKVIAAAAIVVAGLSMTACSSDADVVSENLSKSAEQFEIDRRIVFYNGITDKYILTIEGRCSVEPGSYLEVICKIGPDEYKKHFLGESDNVTWFAEQLEAADADEYHYRVIFKPESVIPNIDPEVGALDPND
jgi:hypothetical protein